MLRYFLLSFLFYVHLSFCYDYINNESRNYKLKPNHRHETASHYKKFKTQKKNLYRKRYDFPLDNNDPVAQFDVASFIQNSNNKKLHKLPYGDGTRKDYRKFNSNEFMDYENIKNVMEQSAGDDRRDSWTDYLNIDDSHALKVTEPARSADEPAHQKEYDYNFASLAESTRDNAASHQEYPAKHVYHDQIIDYTAVHHPEKKGVLKNFKFPFFFRNKTTTSMTPKKDCKKKNMKRLKVGKCKESVTVDGQQNLGIESLYGLEPKNIFNKNKRSYGIVMCPACKKKYEENNSVKSVPKTRELTEQIVHNCRQFYQNAAAEERKTLGPKNVFMQPEIRLKRQQFDDKERQMKEIEEVARKIASVTVDSANKKKVTISTMSSPLK